MALRRQQNKSYWSEPTKESIFRTSFGLPDEESPLAEVHAVLSLQNKDESYSGKLYLSNSFLTFASLDRRSCRLSLPLATVRRVEKLAPGQDGMVVGAFALSLTLFHGLRIVLQLNSLRPTNDAFCAILRTRLKASLPQMKALKPFTQTFFSEWYLSPARELEAFEESRKKEGIKGKEEELLISFEEKGKGKEQEQEEEEEGREWTTQGGIDNGFHGGLGLVFKFPGDPRKLREKSKMKLWKDYIRQHGRNLTLIRYPAFNRLVQVGLPNRLRGEIWELTCGSMFLRLQNPGVYAKILQDNEGRTSASTDDIEKDLHRSLPEYAAYQSSVGIDTMRRVLTAYSWSNPALGYCQAMNLVVASFLIYMSEEQTFWCLSVLCDRLLPGYYSPSMYGTVLDQRVFEHLVERCLPELHDHFASVDIQLSIASLPWFLSCFIASMPMVFAFRIIDCFFLWGPKVLFQVSLAILKINGEDLLETTDDGAFINLMKRYFATLGDPAHPNSSDPRVRQITRFQELLVVAFREFVNITDETIAGERKRFRGEVVVSIETFAKRTALRALKVTGRLDKNQLSLIYDHFQLAVLKSRDSSAANSTGRSRNSSVSAKSITSSSSSPREEDKPETRIHRTAFGEFLGEIATWARDEKLVRNGFHERLERKPADHELIDRIFIAWDQSNAGALSFQDIVNGFDSVLFNDLMSNLAWLFSVHDKDGDGFLTKDEVLQLSESLLFIFRNEPGDRYLGSVSNLIQNLFEYAESTMEVPAPTPKSPGNQHTRTASVVYDNPHRPYLGLATFRMCVLADPLLEDFFASDLTLSWKLEVLIPEEKTAAPGPVGWLGNLGGLVNGLLDENKDRINRLADEVGKRLDIQTVEHRPSIGKLDAADAALEPPPRMSLFSGFGGLPSSPIQPLPEPLPAVSTPHPLSAAAMRLPAYPTYVAAPGENPWAEVTSSNREIDVRAAAASLERTQFVIDHAGDGGEEEDAGDVDDQNLLDEVDTMLSQDEGSSKAKAVDDILAREDGQRLF